MKAERTCCFIGHRKIKCTLELRERLQSILLDLIENGTTDFIFGDHSEFNDLCYEVVTKLKEKHPEIGRINFRKTFEDTADYTMQFLIKGYEKSICPYQTTDCGYRIADDRKLKAVRHLLLNTPKREENVL